MPLLIQYTGPYAAPTVVCDHCGTPITDAKDGNYQWSHEVLGEGVTAPMLFTHKACCRAFEQARGGSWGAIGLECLPFYLAHNLHVTWRTARTYAQLMAAG
jgi:hypothetical protein